MSRSSLILSMLTLVHCASSGWTSRYEVRTLGRGGDGGHRIRIADLELHLSVSPMSKDQRLIDVKVQVRNHGTSQVTLTSEGARLSAKSQSWMAVEWRAIGNADGTDSIKVLPPPVSWTSTLPPEASLPSKVEKRVVLERMEECQLLCAFELGNRRFPDNLLLTIGSVYRDGEAVDLGAIQLYVPE